jgi:hypothetical protein
MTVSVEEGLGVSVQLGWPRRSNHHSQSSLESATNHARPTDFYRPATAVLPRPLLKTPAFKLTSPLTILGPSAANDARQVDRRRKPLSSEHAHAGSAIVLAWDELSTLVSVAPAVVTVVIVKPAAIVVAPVLAASVILSSWWLPICIKPALALTLLTATLTVGSSFPLPNLVVTTVITANASSHVLGLWDLVCLDQSKPLQHHQQLLVVKLQPRQHVVLQGLARIGERTLLIAANVYLVRIGLLLWRLGDCFRRKQHVPTLEELQEDQHEQDRQWDTHPQTESVSTPEHPALILAVPRQYVILEPRWKWRCQPSSESTIAIAPTSRLQLALHAPRLRLRSPVSIFGRHLQLPTPFPSAPAVLPIAASAEPRASGHVLASEPAVASKAVAVCATLVAVAAESAAAELLVSLLRIRVLNNKRSMFKFFDVLY